MASWNDVSEAAPGLAAAVQARFEATGLGFLATLRSNGFPRISGIEPSFVAGEMWLGMMDQSRKALDLRRDPRLALHSASADKNVKEGDARITGTGVELFEGDEHRQAYVEHLGGGAAPGPMHVFRVDVTEVMLLKPAGDHLLIDSWVEGRGIRRVKRY